MSAPTREDIETLTPAARGLVLRADITAPSNWRAAQHFDAWLKSHAIWPASPASTRGALTRRIRDGGAPNGALCHAPRRRARSRRRCMTRRAPGPASKAWTSPRRSPAARPIAGTRRALGARASGYGKLDAAALPRRRRRLRRQAQHPAHAGERRLPRHRGAGDRQRRGHPAPPARRHLPVERPGRSGGDRRLCGAGDPELLATRQAALRHLPRPSAAGAGARRQDAKMAIGHRGANHPVKDLATGKVEITSQNHGFCVLPESLPAERRGDACLAVRRLQRGAAGSRASRCSRCSTTPRPAPARRTATISSSASSR